MLSIAQYGHAEYVDGTQVPVCMTAVDTAWSIAFFAVSIGLFFVAPLAILIVLYTVIAKHLMDNPGITSHGNRSNVLRYRKQVILMLGAVVASFFLCLAPFRALTVWIIVMPAESIVALGMDGYYSLLYFCRIMLYLNSALNPILYNLMSSKFRDGFLRLLCCRSRTAAGKLKTGTGRMGTFNTTSTNLSSSQSGADRQRSKNGGAGAADPMSVRRYQTGSKAAAASAVAVAAAAAHQHMSSTGGETSDSDVPPERSECVPVTTKTLTRRMRKQQFADIVESCADDVVDKCAMDDDAEPEDISGVCLTGRLATASRSRRPSTTYILQYAKSLKPSRTNGSRLADWRKRQTSEPTSASDDGDASMCNGRSELREADKNADGIPQSRIQVQVHVEEGNAPEESNPAGDRSHIECHQHMNAIIQCGALDNGAEVNKIEQNEEAEDKECSRFLKGSRCNFESLV